MPKNRKTLIGTVGAIMLLATTACGAGGTRGPDQANGDQGANGTESINVLTLQDPFWYAIDELIPEFEEETGIRVNFEGVDYDTLNSRATNSFTSSQGDIDVIAPDSMWLSRFAENGWLAELDERIEDDADEVDLLDFIPSSIYSLSSWNDHLYTLPVATYGTQVLYRPSVFEELGIEAPPETISDDWTWEDYLSTVEAIDGNEVHGVDMHGTVVVAASPQPITHIWAQVAASMGGRWVKAFPDADVWDFSPQFDSSEIVASLDMYKRLYAHSPEESINYLWFDAGTRFGSGDIGIMYHWTPYARLIQRSEYMGTIESDIGADWATGALPVAEGQEPVSNVGGFAFGIGANSDNQDAAWKFIKWATSPETQKKMALLDNHQFADFSRYSLYEDEELLDVFPYLPSQLDVIDAGNGKIVRPPMKNYTTLEQAIGTNLNAMLANDDDPGQTAARIQEELTTILEEEQYLPWDGETIKDSLPRTEELMSELAGE